jgi:hypothetical protein
MVARIPAVRSDCDTLDDRQLSSTERADLARDVLADATRMTAYAEIRMSEDCHYTPHYEAWISRFAGPSSR